MTQVSYFQIKKKNGISGNLLSTLTDFLKLRKQRLLLNDQLSSWSNIESGGPRRSIFGPFLFLIHKNNILDSFKQMPGFLQTMSL